MPSSTGKGSMAEQRLQHPEQAAGPGPGVRPSAAFTALAERTVVLQRRHQEAVATARALRHQALVGQARRRVAHERRRGGGPGPLAWFALEGVIDDLCASRD
jgi:hypothetical protein